MLASIADSPFAARALAFGLFAAALLAFSLPFVSVSADRRSAEATGYELATSDVTFEGTYVQEAFRGEVEYWIARGEVPALTAFILLAAAGALVWIPWRIGPALSLTAGLFALFALYAFFQRVGSMVALVETERQVGFWVAVVLALAADVWTMLLFARTPFWWKPDLSRHRDYFA